MGKTKRKKSREAGPRQVSLPGAKVSRVPKVSASCHAWERHKQELEDAKEALKRAEESVVGEMRKAGIKDYRHSGRHFWLEAGEEKLKTKKEPD